MEYVAGPSLSQVIEAAIERINARSEDALFVARELSRGLSYAHGFGAPRDPVLALFTAT